MCIFLTAARRDGSPMLSDTHLRRLFKQVNQGQQYERMALPVEAAFLHQAGVVGSNAHNPKLVSIAHAAAALEAAGLPDTFIAALRTARTLPRNDQVPALAVVEINASAGGPVTALPKTLSKCTLAPEIIADSYMLPDACIKGTLAQQFAAFSRWCA